MSTREDIGADFLNHVAKHLMTVDLDNGVHRSLLFKEPGTYNRYFRIITYPGELVITGDMSTFVFSRLHDMFEFFRKDVGQINPQYWSEKLVAVSRKGGAQEYCENTFRERVNERLADFLADEELTDGEIAELREAVDDEVLREADGDEPSAMRAAMDFRWQGREVFVDFWETNLKAYTYHFLWCCHAIVWGIRQFDEYQDALKPAGGLPQLTEVAQ